MIKQQQTLTFLHMGRRGQAPTLAGGTWILLSAGYGYGGFALGLTICLGSGNQGFGGTLPCFTLVPPVTVPTVVLLLAGQGLWVGGPGAGKLLVGHEGDTGGCVVRSNAR